MEEKRDIKSLSYEEVLTFAEELGEKIGLALREQQEVCSVQDIVVARMIAMELVEGLTEEEKKEQQILRREYVDAFKRNLRGQLNNISIKEKDGSITNLGEKYGQKKGN